MEIIKEMFAFIFGANISDNVTKYLYLTGTTTSSSMTSSSSGFNISLILNLASNITQDIILPIADCLLIMYFVFNLIEMASNENFTLQHFGKLGLKFCVFHILIVNTFAIMLTIVSIGSALVTETNSKIGSIAQMTPGSTVVESKVLGNVNIMDEASDTYNNLKDEYDAYNDDWNNNSFIKFIVGGGIGKLVTYMKDSVSTGFLLLVPFIISVLCYGDIILVALIRILQIAIRLPLMPIAISDIYNGGTHSRGMSTFKAMIALAVQGMIIIIIVAMGNALCTALYSGNLFAAAFLMSIVKLAQISLLNKSLDVSKELLAV